MDKNVDQVKNTKELKRLTDLIYSMARSGNKYSLEIHMAGGSLSWKVTSHGNPSKTEMREA